MPRLFYFQNGLYALSMPFDFMTSRAVGLVNDDKKALASDGCFVVLLMAPT
jgi:hypothetical protein